MSLFQSTVVNKYLKSQDKVKLAEKWELYKSHFLNPVIQENIRNSKEEQYQEGFLRDLFVKILGYTLNPAHDFNLTTEIKNVKDNKKADGGIIINDVVVGVIELKGTNTTDLGRVEEQAFGYKNNQQGCTYVITSNFEKLRFYIDNAIEFKEFNLFQLNEKEFDLLYLCVGFENIKNNVPKKLKDESLSTEELITKQLYKDYSVFKRELFHNLTELNPQFEPLELFQKSQKLLDRFLFLFFAEDRDLLPPNSVRVILKQWKQLQELDAYTPLYERFKMYFGYLNTGFKGKKHDVFAYNGGLFKPDAILDEVKIDDELLYKYTHIISDYNFASEVDVNILGHIFENSLNELDEIKADLEGTPLDKSNTKRKKDGVFYTPKYITKYIVDNTVGKLCEEKKAELEIIEEEYHSDSKRQKRTIKNLADRLTSYREWLLQLTICDPACGSGAFLNQALDFLIHEHGYIDELQAKLFGDAMVLSDVEMSILEHNLFGVDLNEESVEIAKLSLWLRTAQPNRKLNDLNDNIKCGNSLIDDPEVAGDKAFNWKEEFPHIFEKGGFDVVIGNPPYVRQELIKQYSKYLKANYVSFSGKADLFVYFYELANRIGNNDSIVGYISSGKFLEAQYGEPLLNFLIKEVSFLQIIDFKDAEIFEGVTAYPLILIFQNKSELHEEFNYIDLSELNINQIKDKISNLDFNVIVTNDFIENGYSFISKEISSLIGKISEDSMTLSQMNKKPLVGIKTGYNEGYIISESKYSKNYVFGKDIKKYSSIQSNEMIFFPYKWDLEYKLIPSTEKELEYLEPQKSRLEKRAIIKEGIINGNKIWYEFQQINRSLNFENEYIIYPNVSLGNNFTLSKGNIIDMTGFIIESNSKFLLSILNSKLTAFLMSIYAISRRGGYLEYKTQYLNRIPVKQISLSMQQPFMEKADKMLQLNKVLQETSQKFHRTLQRKFEGLEKLPRKLESWYELSYSEFIKELKKKKITLSLSEEAEWEDYFLSEQHKALEIQSKIEATDKEIDAMVYELYGLTEEEIEIVENN